MHHHWQHSYLRACSSSKLPIAPMGFSHVLFCAWLAGRRCVHQPWHGELLIVHHHGQHSCLCTCSRSKVPITQMGFSHVSRLCLQGGGVYIGSGTVTFLSCTVTGNTASHVRAHAQTSHRPNGKLPCPDGRLTFCSLFAGRRCRRGWHSDL